MDVEELAHIESGAAAWEAAPGRGPSRRRSARESVRYHPYRRPSVVTPEQQQDSWLPAPVVYVDVDTLMGDVDADGDVLMKDVQAHADPFSGHLDGSGDTVMGLA
jgi:hypothetical protein